MSLFKRIANVVRSNVNDVLDKAEDPRKILDQTILDMQKEHKRAKQKLIETMTLQKQSEKQAETLGKQAAEWEHKAMAALKAGDESLARQALTEKQKVEEMAQEATAGSAQQKGFTEELKRNVKALEEKIEEAKKKRDELIARLKAAEMKKKQASMSESGGTSDAVSDSSAFDTFDRMVERIERSEAEVEAHKELMGVTANEVDGQLEAHYKQKTEDDLLAQLKAKMDAENGPAAAPAPAAAAAPAADDAAGDKSAAIDDELAALRAKLDD